MSRNFPSAVLAAMLLTAALPLSGCTALGRISGPLDRAATVLFTSATLNDLQMVGIKSGALIPIKAGAFSTSATPGTGANQELEDALGQAPLGVLVPITKVGETTPWWIFCPVGEMQERCEQIPSNAQVTFTGQPIARGSVFLATHLTWSAQ